MKTCSSIVIVQASIVVEQASIESFIFQQAIDPQ